MLSCERLSMREARSVLTDARLLTQATRLLMTAPDE